jgi:hypothetical protein
MFNATHRTLKRLAALVWLGGVAALLVKSTRLLVAAHQSGARDIVVLSAVLCGVGIGLLKARFLFVRVCRSNLHRIDGLERPMVWQFYRARFFVFLGLMIASGAYLARRVQGDAMLEIPLAVLELSVGIALLASSSCFWTPKPH